MAFLQIYCGFCLASIVDFCVGAIYTLILLYVIAFFFYYPDSREYKDVKMKTYVYNLHGKLYSWGSFILCTHTHTICFPINMQTLVTMKSCLSLVFCKY